MLIYFLENNYFMLISLQEPSDMIAIKADDILQDAGV